MLRAEMGSSHGMRNEMALCRKIPQFCIDAQDAVFTNDSMSGSTTAIELGRIIPSFQKADVFQLCPHQERVLNKPAKRLQQNG